MKNCLLKIENISYTYVHTGWKLDSISLSINTGDFVGIVGPNGSGKSTLLKIAAGILPPVSGRVHLEGKHIRKIPRKKLAQSMGYLPQQINPVFDFNVEEVISMGRFCHSKGMGLITQEDRQIVADCMQATETFSLRNRSITELSGGERQRVMLASVLAQQPGIMLLDEPMTGLDMHHQVAFFKLLSQFAAKGMAVVVITHDLNLASQFCDKVLLLNKGRKEIFDSVEKVFGRIEQLEIYSKDLSIFKHPLNQKPAVLPYNSESEKGIENDKIN
ncbi:MAG: ABC transporter ATP-binding protein [Phycisphaerae bacterium]|nr:ABC transporter ATP-binding protein [Phycisphaerae bacterium]